MTSLLVSDTSKLATRLHFQGSTAHTGAPQCSSAWPGNREQTNSGIFLHSEVGCDER